MLKMITGLVAKALRLGGAEQEANNTGVEEAHKAGVTDTDSSMLDWLDRQSNWSGQVAFRWSTTGMGWRLMEVPDDYPGTLQEGNVTPPSRKVRQAISDAMLMASPTDAQALDWLDEQTGSYTGLVIWRLSTRGRGWRLHETSWNGAKATVRETISDAMRRESGVNAARAAAMERLGCPPRKGETRVVTPSRMYCITQSGLSVFECALMAQDGYERWEESSLDAAVESVIRGADTINHASITCDHITIQLRYTLNAALCRKCGDLIASRHRHDFVECGCGLIAVDGGHDHSRRVGEFDIIGEVPNQDLFDRLIALPANDREAEWNWSRYTKEGTVKETTRW